PAAERAGGSPARRHPARDRVVRLRRGMARLAGAGAGGGLAALAGRTRGRAGIARRAAPLLAALDAGTARRARGSTAHGGARSGPSRSVAGVRLSRSEHAAPARHAEPSPVAAAAPARSRGRGDGVAPAPAGRLAAPALVPRRSRPAR